MVNDRIQDITRPMNRIDIWQHMYIGKKLNQINSFERSYRSTISFYKLYTWSRARLEQIKNSGSLRYLDNDSLVYQV
jgi:CRISPR/Cas system-associated endonuclease Cas1